MLVPRCKGLRIARIVETSNAESPTPMNIYITLQDHGGLHQDLCGLYINIPRGVPVALFLTIHLKLRSSYSVKIKAFSYAFYMYVSCPRPTQGAFSKGNDGTNIHIFTKPKKNYTKKLRQARKKKRCAWAHLYTILYLLYLEKTNRRSLLTLPRR